MRNIRRDSNDELKKLTKNKEISEDEERRLQDIIQKNTDTFIDEIDTMINVKEKHLLTIYSNKNCFSLKKNYLKKIKSLIILQ